MMESTRDPSVLFVGGVWGGFIFSDFLFASDGMFSVGKILEMIAKSGLTMTELDQQLGHRYQYQIDVSCPWEVKGTVMRRAMEYSENMRRQLVEGVKIFTDGESVLLQPQKENAGFSIIAESIHFDGAVALAKKYSSLLSHWRDGGE
jgi:mannose-1-phosphate guanylyltransferase/phosphomannomutase